MDTLSQLRQELVKELNTIQENKDSLESVDQLSEQHETELNGSIYTIKKIIKRIDELLEVAHEQK